MGEFQINQIKTQISNKANTVHCLVMAFIFIAVIDE